MEQPVLEIESRFASLKFKRVIRICAKTSKIALGLQRLLSKPIAIFGLMCCYSGVYSALATAETSPVLELEYQSETMAEGLKLPWSMVNIGPGEWLITERDGHIVHADSGNSSRQNVALDGLYVASQGGLLDIIKGPDFDESGILFLSYAKGDKSANTLVVGSIEFDGKTFSEFSPIFEVEDTKNTAVHYGGRLLLLPDNTLLVTTGDGYDFREEPQKLSSQMGKMLRINLDGSIPSDNPYVTAADAKQRAIYSLGHRNPQGLAYDPVNGRIYEHEHGPAGGDEVNIIQPKLNYGWPIITYGKDYSGARISPYTEYEGLEQPVVNWTPSVAPSGMAHYHVAQNPAFPQLQQHLLVTTLADKKLYALDTTENYSQYHLFEDLEGRLRDVYVTKNGDVAVLTDGEDASLFLYTSP